MGIPPFAVAGWRFLIGFLLIWLWAILNGVRLRFPRGFRLSLACFAAVFVIQISAINFANEFTFSNYSAVLLNTSPLFVAALAHLLIPSDRLYPAKVCGLILAFLGVTVVFATGSGGSEYLILGNFLALISGFLLAVIQIFAKFLLKRLTPLEVVFWEIGLGVPLFFLLSLIFERDSAYVLTLPVVLSVLYQGVVIAGFCFVVWLYLLKLYSASQLSSFQFSTPVFGVLLSWIFLGEVISSRFALGVGLVAVGIYLVTAVGGVSAEERGSE